MPVDKAIKMEGVEVSLLQLAYSNDPQLCHSPEQHAFIYFLRISNNTDEEVILDGRKWILRYESGHHEVFEGDRIVGQIVELQPGEDFEYNSYHLVSRNCVVTGSYHGNLPNGQKIWVEIPPFELEIPQNP